MITQAGILYLHNLATYLSQNLLPPSVSFIEVMALCCQVWSLLLGAPGLLSLAGQEPVKHGLSFLFISCHLSPLNSSKSGVNQRNACSEAEPVMI